MSPRIRPGKLHHASVRITSLECSRGFYEDLLGLEAVDRPDLGFPGRWYGAGEGQIHLLEIPKQGDGIDPTDPHFAIEVEDFEATRRELEAGKIPFLELGDAMWIRDPDGNVVELRRSGS